MNEDKQMVIEYDLAREAINQLLDELDRFDESDHDWAERQKSIIRDSLDDCFELAIRSKSRDAEHAAALAASEERVRELEGLLRIWLAGFESHHALGRCEESTRKALEPTP